MGYWIQKVTKAARAWRICIPMRLIREKGWENVKYVCIKDIWGDRIVIEKAGFDEADEKEDRRSVYVDD